MWLRNVQEETGERPGVEWRPFVLAQANNKSGNGWKAWEHPPGEDNRGLLAFKAGIAARNQGQDVSDDFHLTVLKSRHEDRRDLLDMGVIVDAAKRVGLDIGRLETDMEDANILKYIEESHMEATEVHGVFGVPTFVFPDGKAAFIKMFYPPREQSVEIYESLTKLTSQWNNIGEIKRPQPPWPAGVRPS